MKSLGSKAKGVRLERMKASPRWAGEGFRNRHPILPGLRDPSAPMPTWTEFFCGGDRRTPARPLPSMSPLEAWRRKPDSGLRATWLGHSTVLIEIDGVRVLTDPVWGPRASPLAARRPQALPAGPGRVARDAAGGPRDHLARSLRPPRLSDDPRARQERGAVRDLARRRRSSRGLGRRARAHHGARLVGIARAADSRRARDGRAVAALLGAYG